MLKKTNPLILVAVLLCLFRADFQSARAWNPACHVVLRMVNANRLVLAPNQGFNITNECPGSIHSAPWGNWGVSSNVGTKQNGRQFDGWNCGSSFCEWNSCTSEFSPPNCTYYNYLGCTKQQTVTGSNTHGTVTFLYGTQCPWESGGYTFGGCKGYDGHTITISSNFMTMYELDPVLL